MLALIIKTSAIISSAVLYRLGGAEGCSTKYRDFAVAFAYLPYAIVGSISWLAFSVRVTALALSMGLWRKYFSNAVVEEAGRGAFIILTLFLLRNYDA